MPQNRDPKTGRYISDGGVNPRIQKAKDVGSGNYTISNPITQLTDYEASAIDTLIKGKETTLFNAPVADVPLTNLRSWQKALRKDSVEYFAQGGTSEDYPTILKTANGYNVIMDGNHRVNQALKDGKTSIKAHYSGVADLGKK